MAFVTEIETQELIASLQKRDEAAFSLLYDAYSSVLFGVAFRIVDNKSIAEELFQDVFVKIWRHIDSYDARKGTLFTWMFNITRNTCKDYLRSKQYRYQKMMAQEGLDYISSKYMPQTASNEGENFDLQLLVLDLEPKYKEIIDLVYIFGYSQEQVSQKLNLPLGTVKTRSRIALKRLRDIYML